MDDKYPHFNPSQDYAHFEPSTACGDNKTI